jgi:hypothetical protein
MKQLKKQMEEIHQAFVNWYNGRIPKEKKWFDENITNYLDSDFQGVFPDGEKVTKKSFTSSIFKDYGNAQRFDIKLKNFKFKRLGKDYVLARYQEWQYEGKKVTLKIRTASTFKKDKNKYLWIQMHESPINP